MIKFNIKFIICLLITSSAFPAAADVYDTYGYGDRGMSMGGALCAGTDDTTALYYNPAGLGRMKGNNIGFSYFYSMPDLQVSNAPISAPGKNDTELGMFMVDLALDVNKFFNLPVQVTFAFGMCVMDNLNLISLEDVEESTPVYLRYGAPVKRTAIYTGMGIEVIPNWLWIGGGAHAMVAGDAAVNFTLNTEDFSTTKPITPSSQEVWMDAKTKVSPTGGIIFNPVSTLNVGISYKGAIDIKFDPFIANIDLTIGTNSALISAYTAILTDYTPETYRLGLSYKFGGLTLENDLSFESWSKYKFSFPREMRRVTPQFNDTMAYHAGAQYDISMFNIRGGYHYSETPVPAQSGTSNFLDADKHIFSLGLGMDFVDPTGIVINPVHIGFSLQDQILASRTITKTTGVSMKLTGDVLSAIFSISFKSDFSNNEQKPEEKKDETITTPLKKKKKINQSQEALK